METNQNSEKISHENSDDLQINLISTRLNHLMEILNQFENNKMVDIPEIVIQNINEEIIKKDINKNDLDTFKLQRILKKLNYRKYYEYVPLIIYKLKGIKFPKIKEDDKMKIYNISI